MRHFVATILIAFLIMVGQQMEYETHPKDALPEFCMFLGKFLQLITQGDLTQIFPTFPKPRVKIGFPYEDGSRAVMGVK